MITEIRQLDAMIAFLLDTMEKQFLSEGGLKESMYKARLDWRKKASRILNLLKRELTAKSKIVI